MKELKKGDIVTVMTGVGEYIARLNELNTGYVSVENPRLIVRSEDGKIGFGRGVCMSGIENPKALNFYDVLFVVKANGDFESSWIEATSGLIV